MYYVHQFNYQDVSLILIYDDESRVELDIEIYMLDRGQTDLFFLTVDTHFIKQRILINCGG